MDHDVRCPKNAVKLNHSLIHFLWRIVHLSSTNIVIAAVTALGHNELMTKIHVIIQLTTMSELILALWLHMVSDILVNIGSGQGLNYLCNLNFEIERKWKYILMFSKKEISTMGVN